MITVVAAVVALAIVAPHIIRLADAPPGLAAVVWLSALLLRALTAIFVAIAVLLVLPTTQLFDLVTHWCWETVVPVVATRLGFDGHDVGDAALLLPSLLLAASLVSVFFVLWRTARAVGRLIQRASIGPGPGDSVIVADQAVVVAAAGVRRPQVLISAGALTSLDDDEIAASLDHERGHIAHRHRYALIVGECCRALARLLPGTRSAHRELAFHLERDADRYALRRNHEPVVLASAICKAAQAALSPPVTALGGGSVTRRVSELLAGGAVRSATARLRLLAGGMLALVIVLAAALPSATAQALAHKAEHPVIRHCEHE